MLQLTVSYLKSVPMLKFLFLVIKTTTNVIMSVTKVMPLRSVSTNTTSMMTSLTLAYALLNSERKSPMHPMIQSPLMTTNVLTLMNANLTHALKMVLDAKTTPDYIIVTGTEF